jgi:hypothetical protein
VRAFDQRAAPGGGNQQERHTMGETVRVIDTDPELLRRSAEASLHAADETWIHIRAEVTAADGDYDKLMTTLRPEGPYGYTIQPTFNADGTVRAPILTTREEIRVAYEEVRGRSDLLSSESLIEVRGAWYTFQEAVSIGRMRADNPEKVSSPPTHILGLFPVGAGTGITGELVWPRVPLALLGRGDTPDESAIDPLQARRDLLALSDAYLDAYRAGDADALVETMNDDVQSGVRDYVAGTGALAELRDKEQARAHYAALFEKFEIVSVDLLDRVVQDWYVFFELRVTVQPREGGTPLAFNLAEFYVTGKDSRFFVRIGHGTDPAPVS